MNNQWAVADRISDQIINLLNKEKRLPDFNPVDAFMGQLLAIIGFGRTSPAEGRPEDLERVLSAAMRCIQSAMRSRAAERPR